MSNEESERPVSLKQYVQAIEYVVEYLFDDEQNGYLTDPPEFGPAPNCFQELRLMAAWLRAHTERAARFEGPERFGGFENFETASVHHWLLADQPTREWWQSRLEHLRYYFGEPDQGDREGPRDG